MKDERKYFIRHPLSFILEERGNGSNSPFSKGAGGFEMDAKFISTLNTKEPSIKS